MSFQSTIRSRILGLKSSASLKKTNARTKPRQYNPNILILTGSIGSGHLSVARAIADAVRRIEGKKVHVETIDFITALANFATSATKRIYLGSLKISPKIYELIFAQSTESRWPVKLLNILSAPFMHQKFRELMLEKKPNVIVSTFPIWDMLIKYASKSCNGGRAPFVSVVTDSISVHNAWISGDPDFFIVANDDTKIALRNLGISQKRIKVLGYPVAERFLKHTDCENFKQKWKLSPDKKILLLILSTGINWKKAKQIANTIQNSKLKNLQLIIVAAADEKWKKQLSALKWPWPTRIIGWTNEIHQFIHAADIILTKAGGATVMECINCLKPLVIAEAIPGQEIGNAMLVQKYNLGVVLTRSLSNFDSAIEYILNHEDLIKKNLATQRKPNAARDVANFLINLAKDL